VGAVLATFVRLTEIACLASLDWLLPHAVGKQTSAIAISGIRWFLISNLLMYC
jgi:hypothetical protein